MTFPSRPILLLLLATLTGCRRTIQVPAELQAAFGDRIAFCERMSWSVIDWCIYQMLGDAARPGQDYYPLCAQMRDVDARDACLEQFARTDESSKYDDICAQIEQPRLQESCYLTNAERTAREASTIQTVIEACNKAGNRRMHCLNHTPSQRASLWRTWGSEALMTQEIRTLILTDDDLVRQVGFGRAVAQTGLELLGAQGESLCQLFPTGEALQGCTETFQAWRQGSLQ